MILVTQGHERGIGLEVFLKAILLGARKWGEECLLITSRATLQTHLDRLKLPFEIVENSLVHPGGRVECLWMSKSTLPQSSVAMHEALNILDGDHQNVLFNLPTTKEDLRDPRAPKKLHLGHTEYLRHFFKNDALGMFFVSNQLSSLLLTDHIPLGALTKTLTPAFFKKKLKCSLPVIQKLEPHINRVIISGLNPHSGEGGLLGKEDQKLSVALKTLKFPGLKLEGLIPADSMIRPDTDHHKNLYVYCHHDQGLGPFKSLMGTLGANVTLGLPFIRLSVDHGTAFPLYGKNVADPRGAMFCLQKAIAYQERMQWKRSSSARPEFTT